MVDREPPGSAPEPFLHRWSRRKLDGDATQTPADEVPPALAETAPAAADTGPETPVLTDADMPDLDSMDEHSDYQGFLSPGVSEELRRLALRKLFKSEAFAMRDGLDDYDEDYRSFEALGNVITADMRHQMERQADQLRQALQEAGDSAPDARVGAQVESGGEHTAAPEAQAASTPNDADSGPQKDGAAEQKT